MAQITFVIEDQEEPIGTPRFVFVELTSPVIGADTWTITATNDWIGTGSGEYKVVRGSQLELRDGSWNDERTRLVLENVNYPSDLKSSGGTFKRGKARYVSEARQMSSARCEWSGRNIVPDQW